MKTIRFEFPIALHTYNDEDYYDYDDYDYEISTEKVNKVLAELFADKYNIPTKTAEKIANDFDMYDLLEDEFSDDLEDVLKEMYYMEAWKHYEKNNS